MNKGAQAMTYVTVDKVANLFPGCIPVLYSNIDYQRTEEEKVNYKFIICNYPHKSSSIHLLSPFSNKSNEEIKQESFLRNAKCMIDISGYQLGSSWGTKRAVSYVYMIFLAKHFHIPLYLMPQSFGPFDFKGKGSNIVNLLIRHYLKYPKYIMAREQEGFELLRNKYNLKNVIRTQDLVLEARDINLNNIFVSLPSISDIDIKQNSIAIIPNSKNNQYGDEKAVHKFYRSIVDELINSGKNIYLMYHSNDDYEICDIIKKSFYPDNASIVVITQELDCISFSSIISKFDFVVASRYHSIVHAYKEAVPAIILGWAIKYRELAICFDQQKYCFDIRDALKTEKVLDALSHMLSHFEEESINISLKINVIQKSSVFDYIRN